MKFTVKIETNAAGIQKPRLTFYVRREHEKKARRVRVWCESKSKANERIEDFKKVLKTRGMDGLADEVFGKQLIDAYPSGSLAEAAIQFKGIKDRIDLAGHSTKDIWFRLKWLVEKLGEKQLKEVETLDVQSALDSTPGKSQNRVNYFRVWRGFFNWCLGTKLIGTSPILGVQIPTVRRKLPVIAKPNQIEMLVMAALTDDAKTHGHAASKPGHMLPHILITFFSGIRPEECRKLTSWEDYFNFDRGEAVLDERVTKTSRVRITRLVPHLREILLILKERGHMPSDFSRRVLSRISKNTSIIWVTDLGRHSYASYSFASGMTEAELVHDMGNSVKVLRDHYINRLVTREAAEQYHKILVKLLDRLKPDNVEA